jgi:mRNA-degrading endonuclease RelE of RelBE toxin-antitoxin system
VQRRPSVRLIRTEHCRRAYSKLDPRDRELVRKALAQFLADRTYPGLHVKRVQGTEGIWAMRAGQDIRITFELQESDVSQDHSVLHVVLRNVGHHNRTLENP